MAWRTSLYSTFRWRAPVFLNNKDKDVMNIRRLFSSMLINLFMMMIELPGNGLSFLFYSGQIYWRLNRWSRDPLEKDLNSNCGCRLRVFEKNKDKYLMQRDEPCFSVKWRRISWKMNMAEKRLSFLFQSGQIEWRDILKRARWTWTGSCARKHEDKMMRKKRVCGWCR